MLVRCETKSNRVKGLSFHPTMDWILASLHNGVIQLWDFRVGSLVHRYEEHEGPVRGVCFHISQPMFVSGGDDYKIKVWNYAQQRCLFTLLGHLDYIRTVQFHPEYPWILSASDDQTVRIWNWQNRSCIAVLAGHNHYVMCAQFHAKQDVLVSASLDQTLRVWDISGLKEKTYSVVFDDGKQSQRQGTSVTSTNLLLSAQQTDMFGASDAVCKFILDGHDRGVNWATFHSTLSLIASGGDDRTVRLWRYNDSKWWEVDNFRGHLNNVSCVIFHPTKELLISNSEDRTIRVWDITKRILLHTYRRENDRFWALAAMPGSNTLAVGHDSGAFIFRLHRERIPAQAVNDKIFFVKDDWVSVYDCPTQTTHTLVNCKRSSSKSFFEAYQRIFVNVLNSSSIDILLLYKNSETVEYDFIQFPSLDVIQHPNKATIQRGIATSVCFLTRNRFAVLDKHHHESLAVMSFQLESCKRLELSIPATEIFYAGHNRVLLKADEMVYLYDVPLKKVIADLSCPGSLRYVVWSHQNTYVALVSKHYITLANSNLEFLCSFYETIRIKGGAFDSTGVFIFSTLSHIKYCLPNGDSGVLRSLKSPFYIVKVQHDTLVGFDRKTRAIECLKMNYTEYKMKWNLFKNKHYTVTPLIRSGLLCGDAIVGYLTKKGFPHVALQFVTDHQARFNLALQCGNLAVASEEAIHLNDKLCWEALGVQALRHGSFDIAETSFQNANNFSRLSFLCFLSGDFFKLRKLATMVNRNNDFHASFTNALLLGDVEERIRLLTSMGQIPLAFLTAKLHGLSEMCQALKPALDGVDLDISLSSEATPFTPVESFISFTEEESDNGPWTWPKVPLDKTSSDRLRDVSADPCLSLHHTNLGEHHPSFLADLDDPDTEYQLNNLDGLQDTMAWMDLDHIDDSEFHDGQDFLPAAEVLNESVHEENAFEQKLITTKQKGSLSVLWCDSTGDIYDYVAAGQFKKALQLLRNNIGLMNPEPLKPLFRRIVLSTFTSLSLLPFFPTKVVPLLRTGTLGDQNHKPRRCITLASLHDTESQAHRCLVRGKLNDALQMYTKLLHMAVFVKPDNDQELSEIQGLMSTAASYALAMRVECHRQTLGAKDVARNVELAIYLGSIKLHLSHQFLTWRRSLTVAWKAKNFVAAAAFARKLTQTDFGVQLQSIQEAVSQAKKALAVCESRGSDAISVDYDPHNIDSLIICSTSLSRIGPHHTSTKCPFCSSLAKLEYQGSLCSICQLSNLGSQVSGSLNS